MQQVNLPSGIQVHKLRENTFLKIINSPWEGISFIFFLIWKPLTHIIFSLCLKDLL